MNDLEHILAVNSALEPLYKQMKSSFNLPDGLSQRDIDRDREGDGLTEWERLEREYDRGDRIQEIENDDPKTQ